MKQKNLYSIKYVAARTGMKPHLVRAWESRYQAVVPQRTPTNRRLYCQADIARLQLLKAAVDQGHQISCIAGLTPGELRELLGVGNTVAGAPPAKPAPGGKGEPSAARYLKAGLQAVIDLNPDGLTRVLSDAAVHLTRRSWVEGLIVPLFGKIGEMWSAGELKIVNEHMASNCARMIMWDMLRSVEMSPAAPRIVVGTPVGQWHEMGALVAALASTEAGWRPVYVGPNLPAEELASALDQFDARCIGLSITHSLDDNRIQPELLKLRRYLGPAPCILVGGLQEAAWDDVLRKIAARRMTSWQDMTRMLMHLSEGPPDAGM